MAKKSQYKGYVEYTCPICQDVFQFNGKAKDAKYWHDSEFHPEELVKKHDKRSTVVPVEPLPVAEVPAVEYIATTPATTTVSNVTARLARLQVLVEEKVAKEIALAKDEQAQKVDVDMLMLQIEGLENSTLPLLISTPEPYRNNELIDLLNKELADAKTTLALAMSNPAYLRAKAAKAALDRATRIQAANKQVAQDNATADAVFSPIGKEWLEENTQRFDAMLNGDIWIPRPKRDPKRIPFAQDLWWALQTHAKYGLTDSEGSYLRPPMDGKDRTWDNLEPIVAEVFDELMAKYSFDFGKVKVFNIKVTLKKVDDDGFILETGSKTVPVRYSLPRIEWLERVRHVLHQVWKKTWNRRDVDIANALAELGYYGSGKEDLSREFCTWAGKQDAKTKLGRMTSMEYALLAAKGELPKDAPVKQTRATSRKIGK